MTLAGDVRSIPLSDLVQLSASNKRTCRVALYGSSATGALYLIEGELVHARYGNLAGVEAASSALADPHLRFAVEPHATTKTRTVNLPIPFLLLEAARRQDEGTLAPPGQVTGVDAAAAVEEAESESPAFAPKPRRIRPGPAVAVSIGVLVAGSLALAAMCDITHRGRRVEWNDHGIAASESQAGRHVSAWRFSRAVWEEAIALLLNEPMEEERTEPARPRPRLR